MATARDVMTADLVTVEADATAERIAGLMETRHIRRVLVLREGRLVGLVSRADLLRAILRPEQPAEALKDDAAMLRGVIAAMRAQSWTDTYWVFPNVQDGVVTLYGYARSQVMRDGLRVLAQQVPGVQSVTDEMEEMPMLARVML